ncbi:hypothetical protein SCD_n01560 [Sulfuricella denitrificans skB26]|uniref:YecA family protein n=1 Tax=Sulfuricella denitrificans (strain DSM 22764 / NBRC 105220 / skB26) TaxID=1163617 RepID=S6AH21_SULDS|nr:hypothetical protein SCD_n01560 [Sulfuricella denitrificans skB26]
MSLDKLQGFLCAVISAPDTIAPGQWMHEVFKIGPEHESMELAQEFMTLMMRFYKSVAATLGENQPIKFILKPLTDHQPDYQTWCEGYILGWGLSAEEWLSPGNEPLKKLTFPILLLSGAFKEESERRGKKYLPDDEYTKLLQECADMLPKAVVEIFHYWHSRAKPVSTKRETPKVGRNETCPCGSGLKFKQCCGKERTLH